MSPDRTAYIDSPGRVVPLLTSLFRNRAPSVIFDIGSCEGEDAVRYARAFPMATVYAVEALPDNVSRMHDTLATRGMLDIVVVPYAFSDRVGTAEFHISSGRPPHASPDEDWDYGNKSSSLLAPDLHLQVHPWVSFDEVQSVPVLTLEDFCATAGIRQVDFIHVDVQGAELQVLRGAGAMLESTRAIWLEVESVPLYAGQPLKADVETFMAERGFTLLVDTVRRISGDQLYVRRSDVDLSLRDAIHLLPAYRGGRRLVTRFGRRIRSLGPAGAVRRGR
jgi:FkbM family methyltransferase